MYENGTNLQSEVPRENRAGHVIKRRYSVAASVSALLLWDFPTDAKPGCVRIYSHPAPESNCKHSFIDFVSMQKKIFFLFLPSACSQTADLYKYKHHQVWLELHGDELEAVIPFLSGFCHLSTRWQQIIINNMSHVWSIPFKLWQWWKFSHRSLSLATAASFTATVFKYGGATWLLPQSANLLLCIIHTLIISIMRTQLLGDIIKH